MLLRRTRMSPADREVLKRDGKRKSGTWETFPLLSGMVDTLRSSQRKQGKDGIVSQAKAPR
jgi:hypothetical protein